MNTKKILFVITKLREEEKRILNYLEKIDIVVDVFTDSMPFNIDQTSDYSLGLIRSISQKMAFQHSLYLNANGLRTINSHSAIEICTNKLLQSIVFSKLRIPTPSYRMCTHMNQLYEFFELFDQKFIIKPISSSWGRGIALINSIESLNAWIASRESVDVKAQNFPILVQEYVEKGNFDIRVVIVGDVPVVAFKRISNDNWLTNTHLGAHIEKTEINDEIRSIVKNIIKILGKGCYGLDLLYDFNRKNYVVCEINQNPEFAKSWLIHGVDIAQKISLYISDILNNKGEVFL
jgi:RimK family alpha-L-glutamate ligase